METQESGLSTSLPERPKSATRNKNSNHAPFVMRFLLRLYEHLTLYMVSDPVCFDYFGSFTSSQSSSPWEPRSVCYKRTDEGFRAGEAAE